MFGFEFAWMRLRSLIHVQASNVVAFMGPFGLAFTTIRSSRCAMAEAFETLVQPFSIIAVDLY